MRYSLPKLPRPSPFLRDFILTEATAALTVIGLVVATRLLAKGLGTQEFGVYSLARRVVTMVVPFATLGMGVAITRYAALTGDRDPRFRFFLGGLALAVAPAVLIGLLGAAFARPLSWLVFGRPEQAPVIAAALLMVLGYALYTVLYSFYRGTGRMGRANLWQLLVVVLCPVAIAAAWAKTREVSALVLWMAAAFFLTAVPLAVHAVAGLARRGGLRGAAESARTLLRYGVPRVPGYFALAGLFAVAPFLAPHLAASHEAGLKEAGFLVVGQSLIVIAENGMAAFGLVALPKVAQLYAERREEFVGARVANILAFVFQGGLFATLHLILWSDQIVLRWLGSDYAPAIPAVRMFAVAVVPYGAYMMLRSVLDAVEERALNTRNLLVSLAAAVVISLVLARAGLGMLGLAAGTAAGFVILGISTAQYLWRRFHVRRGQLLVAWCLALNAALLLPAALGKWGLEQSLSGAWLVAAALVLETALAFGYYLALRRRKMEWIVELEKRVFGTPLSGKGLEGLRTRQVPDS